MTNALPDTTWDWTCSLRNSRMHYWTQLKIVTGTLRPKKKRQIESLCRPQNQECDADIFVLVRVGDCFFLEQLFSFQNAEFVSFTSSDSYCHSFYITSPYFETAVSPLYCPSLPRMISFLIFSILDSCKVNLNTFSFQTSSSVSSLFYLYLCLQLSKSHYSFVKLLLDICYDSFVPNYLSLFPILSILHGLSFASLCHTPCFPGQSTIRTSSNFKCIPPSL